MKKLFYVAALTALFVGADQFLKYFILKTLLEGSAFFVLGKWFKIQLFQNEGIAFGMRIPGTLYVIFVVLVMIILFAIYFNFFRKEKSFLMPFALSLILGGAIGNIIDRVQFGYVVDYVDIWIFAVFNLADVFIFIGVLMIIFKLWKKQELAKQS